MADEWICVGDIYHPQGEEGIGPMPVFPAGSVFPMEQLRARTPEVALANAKRRGIDYTVVYPTTGPDVEQNAKNAVLNANNESLKARFESAARADFERDMQALIDIGSLKHPGDVLPSGTLAAQLAQKEAELEALRAQLAEQGVAPSLLPGAPKRGKAQPVVASEDGAASAE